MPTEVGFFHKKSQENIKFLNLKDCCLNNPNYAIICDFLIKFTDILDLPLVPLKDLQLMIGGLGNT